MPRPHLVRSRCTLSLVAALAASACTPHVPDPRPPAQAAVDVQLVSDEADAALAILTARQRGEAPSDAAWRRLFGSSGYMHLQEREAAMGRSFTDSAFARFMMSDTLLRRAPVLDTLVAQLSRIDVTAAAAQALGYLPPGTTLRARMYLEIKPVTNTFVFTGRDSTAGIFVYVKRYDSPAQLQNTLAHELHHIGLNSACHDTTPGTGSAAQRTLLEYLGGFGEGQAMLAAAGGPDVHPHATDPDSVRLRWDRDVASAPRDMAEMSGFFTDVLDGRITSADSVARRARTWYGVQGPWYTVGWLMASTIEREMGRPALVETLCDPTAFLARYDSAAAAANRRGAALPVWDEALVRRLRALRGHAGRK